MGVVTATTTENFLGKCKHQDCDYVIFATGADVQDAEGWADVKPGAGVYRVGNYGRFARCNKNHKVFPVKAVKGTYSKDHQCDSRCLNARGWSCTCSCGGANHGRGHVATVVTAADIPVTTKAKHLGEVGNYIRGEAEVIDVRPVRDGATTLYTFHTVSNADVIKWFVPVNYDPGYIVKQRVTFRAKVKAHGEFRNVPETVVTYLEEVE